MPMLINLSTCSIPERMAWLQQAITPSEVVYIVQYCQMLAWKLVYFGP